jgi:hypothetical protein
MNCEKAYEYLYQYAKDAILSEDKEKLEVHLENCEHCRGIADSLRALLPQIKPAPEGIVRHYNISFQVGDGMILGYYGLENYVKDHKKLNAALEARNGVIPEGEIWFESGFGPGVRHIAEFDNEGNRVEVKITVLSAGPRSGYQQIRYMKMKKVFENHQTNSVSLSEDKYDTYVKSYEAPSLYIAKARNNFGQSAKSGLYLALPGKAVNVRMKQGVDVLDCGAYKFIYDDRYVTENQQVVAECTYNM